jgi:RND family efflux transporter MFP subunit
LAPDHPLPRGKAKRGSRLGVAVGITGILVATGVLGTWFAFGGFRSQRSDLITHRIQKERLELTIVERGALESAKNSDIICNVKSGAKGSSFSTTIKWVIDDGSVVKARDLLIELDPSGLEEQLKQHEITLIQADADVIQAKLTYDIEAKQAESDIETAKVGVDLARLVLTKYLDGDYPQLLKDISSRKLTAESDLGLLRERTSWAQRMVKLGYLSTSQGQSQQIQLQNAELALAKVEEEFRVLQQYERQRAEKDLQSKLDEAIRTLDRVTKQGEAKKQQAHSNLDAKQKILKQARTREKEIKKEIGYCTIRAPQDGMVVYYVNESSRYSGSNRSSLIAQGEPVTEGQKLMRIPDLRTMQVNVKVHEALVSRVQVGQPATVRVDAFPNRLLRGKVKQVATVASQADWYSSDVKVYQTIVSIDETVEGLRPGMSAEVTIEVGDPLDNVVAVPVHAIVGGTELGKYRKCYVRTVAGVEERDIVIGMTNDRMAEVKSGLQEGEHVVVNPRVLIGDTFRTRAPAADRPATSAREEPPAPPPAENGDRPSTGKAPRAKGKAGPTGTK